MKKKLSPSTIPPLPVEALREVEIFEQIASKVIQSCSDPVRMSVNVERVRRVLRTCLVESLEAQLTHYASLPSYRPEWDAKLAKNTIESLIGFFPLFTTGEPFRLGLERTAKEYLAARVKPIHPDMRKLERIDRKKLKDEYLARFLGEVKILDICWSAGQHYREWKRWLKRELKDGTIPDLAFRRVLTSGKRPEELKQKPRPKGWE